MSVITPHQVAQLDSARGLSALVVLLGHAYQTFINPTFSGLSPYIGFFTQFAVMVFFSLSGFLVGSSIFRNIRRNNGFRISEYAYDRALRIYPPLIAATILMILIWKLAPFLFQTGTSMFAESAAKLARTGIVTNTKEILGSLFFLNGFKTATPGPNGPLWSLSYEIWYYVFAGLLFMLPRRKALSICLLIGAIYLTRKNQQFVMLSAVWIAGLILAKYHMAQRLPSTKNLRLVAFSLAVATILAILGVLQIDAGRSAWLKPWNYFMVISGFWFTSILALALSSALVLPTIFQRSAAYSYTLYIIHFPIMLVLFGSFQETILGSLSGAALVAVITVAVCIGLSMAMAKTVENKGFLESLLRRHKFHTVDK